VNRQQFRSSVPGTFTFSFVYGQAFERFPLELAELADTVSVSFISRF